MFGFLLAMVLVVQVVSIANLSLLHSYSWAFNQRDVFISLSNELQKSSDDLTGDSELRGKWRKRMAHATTILLVVRNGEKLVDAQHRCTISLRGGGLHALTEVGTLEENEQRSNDLVGKRGRSPRWKVR